jgi:hypothetical protein
MRPDLWRALDEAIDAFNVATRRHRDALDAYVSSAHAARYDPQVCHPAQKAAEQARAEREIAATEMAQRAREVLDAHHKEQRVLES